MRIGTSIAETSGPDALVKLADQLRAATDDGFASAWMSNIFGLEALISLAVAGSQVPGIELGTAVIPTYPRHPAVLAQQALTTDLAVGGRLTLGIGLSHQIVIQDMYGYSFERPARHMREYLAVLAPLLAGDPVAFEGETVQAHIGLSVPRSGQKVPLLLAALAPQMLRLAGSLADGTVLWMTGPATVRDYIVPSITSAAAEAGRPSPRVVCVLPVCVTDDPEQARVNAGKAFAIYGQLPSYRAMLDREGAAGPGDVAIVGAEDAVAAQIAALADAGVTEFVAGEYARGPDGPRTRALLRKLTSGLS
ncbi:MAG TPA: TIGR03564 family F420-dependent LLM class oxidoreductase [Streptosporangiaceae bacterium]|nr:TIGR03564 family F420-dependent LLM class oxidoreductase [Streptosporangiaceae bacterium]